MEMLTFSQGSLGQTAQRTKMGPQMVNLSSALDSWQRKHSNDGGGNVARNQRQ